MDKLQRNQKYVRITAEEMKYMRRTAGYTWDRSQNKWTNYKGAKNT